MALSLLLVIITNILENAVVTKMCTPKKKLKQVNILLLWLLALQINFCSEVLMVNT